MTYAVFLSSAAKQDLREIYRYIAMQLQSPVNAKAQLERLEQQIAALDTMPERFRVYEHDKFAGSNLRMMPVDNYLVLYVPNRDEKRVTVIRILYGGQNIESCL